MSTDSFKEKLGKSLFIIQCINCKANENRHLKITHDSDQKCCQQGVVKKVFTGRLFSEIRQLLVIIISAFHSQCANSYYSISKLLQGAHRSLCQQLCYCISSFMYHFISHYVSWFQLFCHFFLGYKIITFYMQCH